MTDFTILSHTIRTGETLSITNTGNTLIVKQPHQSSCIPMPKDDQARPCVEFRWVVTPDQDGRQLQYRAWVVGPAHALIVTDNWSDWMAVPTVFQVHKLTPAKTDQ